MLGFSILRFLHIVLPVVRNLKDLVLVYKETPGRKILIKVEATTVIFFCAESALRLDSALPYKH